MPGLCLFHTLSTCRRLIHRQPGDIKVYGRGKVPSLLRFVESSNSWYIYIFHHIWEISVNYFFRYFLCYSLPLGTPITCISGHLKLFHSSPVLCSLFSQNFVFLLGFILDSFHCCIFKFIGPSFFLQCLICCVFHPVFFSPHFLVSVSVFSWSPLSLPNMFSLPEALGVYCISLPCIFQCLFQLLLSSVSFLGELLFLFLYFMFFSSSLHAWSLSIGCPILSALPHNALYISVFLIISLSFVLGLLRNTLILPISF